MVAVKINEMEDDRAELVIEDTIPAFVNAIRRVMVAEVPKMAIDEVSFHLGETSLTADGRVVESTGPVFDEIVAHRLSLLPIPTDLDLFVPRSQCECEGQGCPNCILMYSLDVMGTPEGRSVTSSDLRPVADASMAITDPNIPITKLFEGQSLLLYANASLGTGREHAKWQAVQASGYRMWTTHTVHLDQMTDREAFMDCCGPETVGRNFSGDTAVLTEQEDLIFCQRCDQRERHAVETELNPEKFTLRFETDGALPAHTVLVKAADILIEKFKELEKKLDRLELVEE